MIALLTDFGLSDPYVGIMKAVIFGVDPAAVVVDLSHDVPPQNIAAGALLLEAAWPFLPPATIAVVVVDPGVGTERLRIAVDLGGRYFIGPDNGLITPLLPSAVSAAALDDPSLFVQQRNSATFEGRDIFAPIAARLHRDGRLDSLGTPMEISALQKAAIPDAVVSTDRVAATILWRDRFGNLVTDLRSGEFQRWRRRSRRFVAEIGGRSWPLDFAPSYGFAGAGGLLLAESSFGRIEIAVCGGSAADFLGAARDDSLTLRRADG